MAKRRSLLRSTGVMTVMTLLSRVLGLVREQVRAVYLGTGAASDAFGLAATIPNLLRRLLAEGAMTAAFLPAFVEYLKRGDEEDTRRFLSRFFTLLTFAVTLICLAGILITPWLIETFFSSEFGQVEGKVPLTIVLTQLMWPYLGFVSIAALIQAVLNAHKIFGPSAFTPVLLNLAIIGCGIGLANVLPDPSYALVAGFLVGGFVQAIFQIPWLLKRTRTRFGLDLGFLRDRGVRRVLVTMIPGVFAAGIYQINVFVSQMIASTLQGGAIASLQYSVRLQELVLGVFVVSIAQVILPTLSEHTAAGDDDALKDTLAYATGLVAFVTLPATAGLILVGEPIVRLLFQYGAFDAQSTAKTVLALNFHALGLLPIAATRIYQQAFYAYKDLRTPTIVAAVVMVINIVGCLVLAIPLSHGGIALAGSIAALVNGALLLWLLRRRIGPLGGSAILARILRMSAATAVMIAALIALRTLWPSDSVPRGLLLAVWVLAACLLAASVYVAACKLLRVNELDGVLGAVLRRLRRR